MSTLIAPIIQSYLNDVKSTVNEIINPLTNSPVQIPYYNVLYNAAGQLDTLSNADATQYMGLIQSLLGRANCVGFTAPTELSLPTDHHLHPDTGIEWYWVACHLNVTDPYGNKGRISTLVDMTRNRCVGVQAQQDAGWTDEEVTLANTIATVTVDMNPAERKIYRRNLNSQWPLKGGVVNFSKPGNDTFFFQCGPDQLTGSTNVLPLNVIVNDGTNMQLNMTFTNQAQFNVETAFFKQGVPIIGGNGGSGVTPVPTPGIYYSWPQLQVTGSVTVNNTTYIIDSGTGWIDHEIMMSSLQNAPTKTEPDGAVHPIPFVEDPTPLNGWVWQFYNLENNMSFTGAGFVLGQMTTTPEMSYGYFLQPDNKGGWTAIFINGNIDLLYPNVFPSQCGDPSSVGVIIPTVRAYTSVENELLGHPLSGVVTPWYSDGTFNFPNGNICSEAPGDYTDMSGNYANGVGYMESVGFQPVASYHAYALNILQGNK